MDDGRRRSTRLATLGNARFLGSTFVLVGVLATLATLVLSVWQEAVADGAIEVVPVIDAALAAAPDARWFHVATALGVSLLVVGFGYVLKVLAVIGETQFVDFGPERP